MKLRQHMRRPLILSTVASAAVVLFLAAAPSWAATLRTVRIFFEYNFTDDDLGVQVFLDGDAWRSLTIADPGGTPILQMDANGALGVLGLTELFWESHEPSPEEVLTLFQPGQYKFVVVGVEGDQITGSAALSHDLPPPAVVLSPEEDGSVDPDAATITWSHPQPRRLAGFEVIVENVTAGVQRTSFTLPSSATTVRIAPEALAGPGKSFKLEVLAVSTNGNKTIVEVPFTTR